MGKMRETGSRYGTAGGKQSHFFFVFVTAFLMEEKSDCELSEGELEVDSGEKKNEKKEQNLEDNLFRKLTRDLLEGNDFDLDLFAELPPKEQKILRHQQAQRKEMHFKTSAEKPVLKPREELASDGKPKQHAGSPLEAFGQLWFGPLEDTLLDAMNKRRERRYNERKNTADPTEPSRGRPEKNCPEKEKMRAQEKRRVQYLKRFKNPFTK
jgi:hypothetical protein